MAKANISSVDMGNGDKIAALGNQYKAAMKGEFKGKNKNPEEQVVNARKAEHIAATKAKTRKKAKLAKATRKKNKK